MKFNQAVVTSALFAMWTSAEAREESTRKMEAAYIAVDFPNPCVDLPLDRSGNGWSNLGPSDDSSTENVPIPFVFSLFGTAYSSLWVNNNGNISFDGPKESFAPTGFPNPDDVLVAAWWTDIDTVGSDSGTVWYKAIASNTFAAAWDRVGVFRENDSGPNTFQILISDGTDAAMGIGNNICFCYVDIGSLSSLFSPNIVASVGANRGNGIDYDQVGTFDHSGTDYDGPFGGNDGWDYLDNKSFCVNYGEAPPTAPPSVSPAPSAAPSVSPAPSAAPSVSPAPSAAPSVSPAPSEFPSAMPSPAPAASPSQTPSPPPSASPAMAPSPSGNLTLLAAIASAIISAILGLIGFVLFFFIGGSSDSSDSVSAITKKSNRTERLLF